MSATYHLSVITPRGEIFSGDIESLVAPGEEGYIGVLAGHAPMIAALTNGAMTLRTGDERTFYAVGSGVLEVAHGQVLVLVDDAVRTASLDEATDRSRELVPEHS